MKMKYALMWRRKWQPTHSTIQQQQIYGLPVQQNPNLSYTIHYIDDNWILRSHCLQAHFVPESHTGNNLQDALLSTLQEWNLDDSRQVVITTDNTFNVKLACQLLKWRQLSCFDHNLDLAIKKSLYDQRVDRVLRLSRQIVSAFSSSWTRTKTLADIQQQRGLPLKKLKPKSCTND